MEITLNLWTLMVMHRRAYWIALLNHQMGLDCNSIIMCENTAEGVLELVTNTSYESRERVTPNYLPN